MISYKIFVLVMFFIAINLSSCSIAKVKTVDRNILLSSPPSKTPQPQISSSASGSIRLIDAGDIFSTINTMKEASTVGFQVILPKKIPLGFSLGTYSSEGVSKVDETVSPALFSLRLTNSKGLYLDIKQVKISNDTKSRINEIENDSDTIIFRKVDINGSLGLFYDHKNDYMIRKMRVKYLLIWEDGSRKILLSTLKDTVSEDILANMARSFYK